MAFCWILLLSLLVIVTQSCSIYIPPGHKYIQQISLLSDLDLVLLKMTSTDDAVSWCKIMNVTDGSVTNVVSCESTDHSIRAWSTGQTDTTSTSVISIKDNNDTTVDVTLQRNGLPITITNIPSKWSGSQNINCNEFTINSMHSTFLMLSYSLIIPSTDVEIIQIEWASTKSNTFTKVATIPETGNWIGTSSSYNLPTYQSIKALRFPNWGSSCGGDYVRGFTFSYDAQTLAISGIILGDKLNVYSGMVDEASDRVYQKATYGTDVTIYDPVFGTSKTFYPNLNYTTDVPSKSPTNHPTKAPTYNPTTYPTADTVAPSKTPSNDPTKYPTTDSIAPSTAAPSQALDEPVDNDQRTDNDSVGSNGAQNNNDDKAGSLIITYDSPWIIAVIVILLICIIGMITYHWIHNKKLKERIIKLESTSTPFSRVNSGSPTSVDNEIYAINRAASTDDNINNQIFLNMVNNPNMMINQIGMNHDDINEGGLPLPPEIPETETPPNENDGMYLNNGMETADAMPVNTNDTNGKDDTEDMYGNTTFTPLPIKQAKMLNVSNKEAYLSDDDFQNVFGMKKDAFYKLPGWKQNNKKKTEGFF